MRASTTADQKRLPKFPTYKEDGTKQRVDGEHREKKNVRWEQKVTKYEKKRSLNKTERGEIGALRCGETPWDNKRINVKKTRRNTGGNTSKVLRWA